VALTRRERPLHRRAFRRDRRNVARVHLLQEERAVRDADPLGLLRRARREPVVDDEERDDPGDPPAEAEARRLRLRQARATRSVRLRRRLRAHARIISAVRGAGDPRSCREPRPSSAALATIAAKAAAWRMPRPPGGSASSKRTNPAAIGTAFVVSSAMPAAVNASPRWKASCSVLVPS